MQHCLGGKDASEWLASGLCCKRVEFDAVRCLHVGGPTLTDSAAVLRYCHCAVFVHQYAHPCAARARVWGVDNREAPVRLCASGGPNSQNWEFKALDATANPYLALAAILLAGCDVRMPNPPGFMV